jgi:hypothetical protein
VDNQVSGHDRGARRLRHLIPSRQQRTSLEYKVVGRLQHMIHSEQPGQWTSVENKVVGRQQHMIPGGKPDQWTSDSL